MFATTPATPPAPLPPPAYFAIAYKRGGGFAPSTSALIVRPGRRAVAASDGTRAGKRVVRFRMPPKRVLALEEALRRSRFRTIQERDGDYCADCFVYEIAYGGHRLSLDESEVPDRLGPVIGQIEAVIAARTIPPNA